MNRKHSERRKHMGYGKKPPKKPKKQKLFKLDWAELEWEKAESK